jgi:hypothetical protein
VIIIQIVSADRVNTWALFLAQTELSRCIKLQKHVSAFVKHTVLKQYTGTIYLTNTQEVTTHSAAPSKCIHSSDQKFDMDRTSTGKQNITSKHHKTLLHTFICRHRMPARKLAPLHLANMPTDARYAKKFPIHRPTLSSRKAPLTNDNVSIYIHYTGYILSEYTV